MEVDYRIEVLKTLCREANQLCDECRLRQTQAEMDHIKAADRLGMLRTLLEAAEEERNEGEQKKMEGMLRPR
jgi:hypothetical protein